MVEGLLHTLHVACVEAELSEQSLSLCEPFYCFIGFPFVSVDEADVAEGLRLPKPIAYLLVEDERVLIGA